MTTLIQFLLLLPLPLVITNLVFFFFSLFFADVFLLLDLGYMHFDKNVTKSYAVPLSVHCIRVHLISVCPNIGEINFDHLVQVIFAL